MREHASKVVCPKCGAGLCSILLVQITHNEEAYYIDRPKEIIDAAGIYEPDAVFRCTAAQCGHEWPVPSWWDGTIRPVEPVLLAMSAEEANIYDLSLVHPPGTWVKVHIAGEGMADTGKVTGYGPGTYHVQLDGDRKETPFYPNEVEPSKHDIPAPEATKYDNPAYEDDGGWLFKVGDTIHVRGTTMSATVVDRSSGSHGREYKRTSTNTGFEAPQCVWVREAQAKEEWSLVAFVATKADSAEATQQAPPLQPGDIVTWARSANKDYHGKLARVVSGQGCTCTIVLFHAVSNLLAGATDYDTTEFLRKVEIGDEFYARDWKSVVACVEDIHRTDGQPDGFYFDHARGEWCPFADCTMVVA